MAQRRVLTGVKQVRRMDNGESDKQPGRDHSWLGRHGELEQVEGKDSEVLGGSDMIYVFFPVADLPLGG